MNFSIDLPVSQISQQVKDIVRKGLYDPVQRITDTNLRGNVFHELFVKLRDM